MRNALTVARRDLAALFRSPLAYVFLILFILAAQFPAVLFAFGVGRADLRLMFVYVPISVSVVAAFVTMRSWAEERQENTYEMLLTFPMKDHELVLGKFLGATAFLGVGIAMTLAVPIMMSTVGKPDWGPVLSGFLGMLLIGAMWTAVGLFFSSLTRSQLLAALATVLFVIVSLLAGSGVVATFLDPIVGTGTTHAVDQIVGTYGHFDAFARGVIELADVVYFVAWTCVFLYLNSVWISFRRHPQSGGTLAAATVLALGCGLLAGRLTTDTSWARADVTEEKAYTLSEGTKRILGRAQVPVRATLYISPNDEMPTEYRRLEQDVVDRLRELQVATGGKLLLTVEHKKADETAEAIAAESEDEALALGDDAMAPKKPEDAAAKELARKEKRLLEKGVRPFPVESHETTSTSVKLIYATLGLAYREKDEELLPLRNPSVVADLEYLVANTVARMTRARPPRIALHLGAEPMDPQMRQMLRGQEPPQPYSQVEQILRQEKYDVVRAGLNAYDPMPDDYDAFVCIGPTRLDERAQWEINRALVSGRPTILAVQRYTWTYRQDPRTGATRAQFSDGEPNVDAVLEPQGLGVSKNILLDDEHETLVVRTSPNDIFGTPVKVPTHIHVKAASISQDSPVTQRVPSLFYLWGTAVTLDEGRLAANALRSQVLWRSSAKACEVDPASKGFSLNMRGRDLAQFPLAVEVKGQFADVFAGKPRPKWSFQLEMTPEGRPRPAPPDGPETPYSAAPGRLILTGCARTWQNGIADKLGDATLLLNAIDALTLDEDLLSVRSKQPMERRLEKPTAARATLFWAVPLGIVPLLVAGAGVGIWLLRVRRREAWVETHGR